jgi:hypothetical protein
MARSTRWTKRAPSAQAALSDHSPSRPSPWRGSSLFNLERGSDGLPVRDMGPQRLKEGARSYIVDGALSQPAPLPCSVARHLLERAEDRE